MKNYVIAAAYALTTGFLGMFLPSVSVVGAFRYPTNILFGFVYGFGWYIAGFISDIRSPQVQMFGALVWPFFVMVTIGYFLGKELSAHTDNAWAILIGCFILVILIIPGDLIGVTPLKYIPIYSNILSAVY
jgi:hypothetical protein